MKVIKTTDGIDPNKQQPFLAPSLKFIQDGAKEVVAAAVRAIIGIAADSSKMYVLHGCVNSGAGSNYIISAGAVYYNGEVYLTDAATFTISGPQVAIATITTTNPSPDPTLFKDGSSFNVHDIRKVVFAAGTSGAGTANWTDMVNKVKRGEVKMFAGPLSGNFDGTGLGLSTGAWEGWALCNGSNGTINLKGKFIVGYDSTDTDYDNLGDTGGAKTVGLILSQIPSHTHDKGTLAISVASGSHDHIIGQSVHTPSDGNGSFDVMRAGDLPQRSGNATTKPVGYNGGGTDPAHTHDNSTFSGDTGSAGSGGSHENRPPFYTLAYIQRV